MPILDWRSFFRDFTLYGAESRNKGYIYANTARLARPARTWNKTHVKKLYRRGDGDAGPRRRARRVPVQG